jgi:hypothetical protein
MRAGTVGAYVEHVNTKTFEGKSAKATAADTAVSAGAAAANTYNGGVVAAIGPALGSRSGLFWECRAG